MSEQRTPAEVMRTYLMDVVQEGRLELIDELALPNIVDEANQAFGGPPGRDGLVAHVVGFRRYVTDAEITIDRIVEGDDEVMARWSFSGTHSGPWLGVAPTGRALQGTVFSFFDLTDGRIARYGVWVHAGFDEPMIFDSAKALAER